MTMLKVFKNNILDFVKEVYSVRFINSNDDFMHREQYRIADIDCDILIEEFEDGRLYQLDIHSNSYGDKKYLSMSYNAVYDVFKVTGTDHEEGPGIMPYLLDDKKDISRVIGEFFLHYADEEKTRDIKINELIR